jgi:hypothetical protein
MLLQLALLAAVSINPPEPQLRKGILIERYQTWGVHTQPFKIVTVNVLVVQDERTGFKDEWLVSEAAYWQVVEGQRISRELPCPWWALP